MLIVPETFSMLMKSSFIVVSGESRKYNLFSELNKKKDPGEEEREINNAREFGVVCHCRCYFGIFFQNMFYWGACCHSSSATFYDRLYISCCSHSSLPSRTSKQRNDKIKTTLLMCGNMLFVRIE